MKIIAIEEHFLTKLVEDEWNKNIDKDDPTQNLHRGEMALFLEDIAGTRLKNRDETGVDIQVLSLTSPSLHNLGTSCQTD